MNAKLEAKQPTKSEPVSVRYGAPAPGDNHVEVLIIGSGFSGLGMGIQLKQRGESSFLILEKAEGVGGVWRDNHYPGCACDVPSHLYSFSFEARPSWTRAFAPQEEIRLYLEHCADKYGLRPHLRLGHEVRVARWEEAQARWRVETAAGEVFTARHLVLGIGALSRPSYPTIAGLENFRGRAFHSAEWDHEFDPRGKRVAVIGTGASAIQIVPRIAAEVAQLTVFQRTPPWVLPKPDREITENEQRWYARLPALQRLRRYYLYYALEMRTFAFTVEPRIMKAAAWLGRRHIESQISDPVLREKVTPTYLPGCKRILLANDYYPALARSNVEVVTERLDHACESGLVTADGKMRELDAIIYGTGFRVTDLLTPLEVIGARGASLNDAWRDGGMEAYLGTVISGFPNLYMLMGPNTGLGHNSMVFMIEAQIDFALRCMRELKARGGNAVQVRPAAQRSFNTGIQEKLKKTVWASGCHSWYLDATGKNTTAWPGFTLGFWWQTRQFHGSDFEFEHAPSTTTIPSGAGVDGHV